MEAQREILFWKKLYTSKEEIDISETDIYKKDIEVLKILLKDRTTNKNIIWGTDCYRQYGEKYSKTSQILPEFIINSKDGIVKPRIEKNKNQQQARARDKGEVFTPAWIVNKQNNLVDNAWFQSENIFNIEVENGWKTIAKKIEFKNELKTWKNYVNANRLEITCGEAPYITSRYDVVSGKYIKVENRVGLLDRKLRIVGENTEEIKEWTEWALKALKSIYAFDFQGDNVLLARENILYTIKEFYQEKFKKELDKKIVREMAEIISWNIWQMDGIKYIVPESCTKNRKIEYSLFGENIIEEECLGCKTGNNYEHNGYYCKIKDWETGREIRVIDLLGGQK